MDDRVVLSTEEALVLLVGCALRKETPEEHVLDDVNCSLLLSLAQSHSVSALVSEALMKTDLFQTLPEDQKNSWKSVRLQAIRKTMLLDSERRAILKELEKRGIWYLPLKGIVLKDFYPAIGLREMGDNDILFDHAFRKEVKGIFEEHGYKALYYKTSNHDVYFKPPFLEFEMHVHPFGEGGEEKYVKYYKDVRPRLLESKVSPYALSFTKEDFYIHFVAHASKHFEGGGTGLRTLADFYVLLRRFGEEYDWTYIQKELEAIGIDEYEERSRLLSLKLFGSREELDEEERQLLSYYLGSSTYGNMENMVGNDLKRLEDTGKSASSARLKYLFSRVFIGRREIKEHYPFVYKHPVLMPFFWLWRILYRVPKGMARIWKELRILFSHR